MRLTNDETFGRVISCIFEIQFLHSTIMTMASCISISACHLWNKKKKTKVRRRRKSHVVKELRQWPCRDDLRLAKIHRQIASDFNFALYNFHTGSSWVLFPHFFMSFFQRWNVITELTIADFTWQSVSSGIYTSSSRARSFELVR